jgi:hypothetical protein
VRYACTTVILLTCLTAAPARAQTAADSLLDRLVGHWHLTGTVQGEKAESHLAAERVLQGKFVRLHWTDLGEPSQYEAMVFLGVDSVTSQIVAHWIDVFGPGPSATIGHGAATGNRLVLDFAYPEGPFRDTFTFDPATGGWRFLLETGDGKGGWTTFGDYAVRPAGR